MTIKVDSTDAFILKNLLGDARKNFSDMAKKIDLSSTAIRNRFLNLEKNGIITGSTILLNPKALGYHCYGFLGLRVDQRKIQEVKAFLSKQSGILFTWDKVQSFNIGNYFSFHTLEDFAQFIEELKKNPYVKETQPLIYLGSPYHQRPDKLIIKSEPTTKKDESTKLEVFANSIKEIGKKTKAELEDIDYKIIEILSKNARLSFNEIAENLGVSTVQVIQRYEKMVKHEVILNSSITVDTQKIGYTANAMIYITLEIGSNVHKMLKKIGELPNVIILVRVMGDCDILTVIALREFSELFTVEKQFRTMKGIKKVQINVNPPFNQWPINFFAPKS